MTIPVPDPTVLVSAMLAVAVLLAVLAVGGRDSRARRRTSRPAAMGTFDGRDPRRTSRSTGIDAVGPSGGGRQLAGPEDAGPFRRTGVGGPSARGRGPRRRIVVGAMLLGVVVMTAAPGFALVALLAAAASLASIRAQRRRTAARRLAVRAEAAPAVLDLLGAALLAGLNPHLAVLRVAERAPDVLEDELVLAASVLHLGGTPAAAVRAAAERSGLDELRAAAGALEAAERWGAPPAEALAARAEALRSRARLRAEAEAGRAAVRLAFPLVLCFLPAFVLLTVVPTVAGSLRALAP